MGKFELQQYWSGFRPYFGSAPSLVARNFALSSTKNLGATREPAEA